MAEIPEQGVAPTYFAAQGVRFIYRVAGIALQHGQILLHRAVEDDFWTLPGGRVEALETAQQALRREMREELGLEAQTGRLLFVVENLFGYQGRAHHEVGLYFAMSLPDFWEGERRGSEGHTRLLYRWFPQAQVPRLPVKPRFLREGLTELPEHPRHVVELEP